MNNAESTAPKTCPLRNAACLKQKCALWIRVEKEAPNPFWKLSYTGCGLINHIPFTPEKRKETTHACKQAATPTKGR